MSGQFRYFVTSLGSELWFYRVFEVPMAEVI